MDKDTLERLRSAYREWNDSKAGSIDIWLNLVADEVDFRSIADGMPGMEFSAARRSRAEVRDYLERLTRDWTMVHQTMDRFVADGDTIVALGRCAWQNKQTGRTVQSPKADVWTFNRGKAIAFFEFYDTAKAFGAAAPN
ncbi:MAG: nuclear transport factor 2 family protein [Alphaproteobacteria bacterium]